MSTTPLPAKGKTGGPPPIQVLLVDDSAVIRGLITRTLESDPDISVVASVGNGSLAVAAVARHAPEVVVLDIEMPVMDGLEFLKNLRALPGGDKPIIVFCTTENDMNHIQKAIEAGANEYIMKPFDSEIIQTKFTQVGLL